MARERKTIDEYLVEGRYDGTSWEEVTREATRRYAQDQWRLYVQAEPNVRFRVRAVRVRISERHPEYIAHHKAQVTKCSNELAERLLAKRKKYEEEQEEKIVTYRRFIDVNL